MRLRLELPVAYLLVAAIVAIVSQRVPSSRSTPAVAQPNARIYRDVHLVAVGDIMMAGPMGALMDRRGRGYPFAAMRPTLRRADIAFGNLECCVATRGRPLVKKFTFEAKPRCALALKEAGFTVVSMANNHAWDFGRDALEESVEHVRAAGVVPVGAGGNRAAAHALRVIRRCGLKIGFLAYLGLNPPLLTESATEPCLAMGTPDVMRREVKAARKRVDVLIVSMHCGHENVTTPTSFQRTLAHTAIDAGADLVIGHHPHVVQPMETYRGKPIAYSLGNFVFSVTGRGTGALLDVLIHRDRTLTANLVPLEMAAQPHFPDQRLASRGHHRRKRFPRRRT